MGKKGNGKGMFVGKSHKDGGIPSEVIETGQKIEIEAEEWYICNDAYNADDIYDFKNKTNRQVLEKFYSEHSCELNQERMSAGDFIVCKLVVKDTKTFNRKGTIKQILNKMQGEKSCKVESGGERLKRQGGEMKGSKVYDIINDDNNGLDETSNGIKFDENIASIDGAAFILYPTSTHSKEIIDKAKKEIRRERDVVAMRIADDGDLDDLYKKLIFRDSRTKKLKWYQIEQDEKLIRKQRKDGVSPEKFVSDFVLPRIRKTESKFKKEYGKSIYELEDGGGVGKSFSEARKWWGNDLSSNEQKKYAKKHLKSYEYQELLGSTMQYSKASRSEKFINEIWEKEGRPKSVLKGIWEKGGNIKGNYFEGELTFLNW